MLDFCFSEELTIDSVMSYFLPYFSPPTPMVMKTRMEKSGPQLHEQSVLLGER